MLPLNIYFEIIHIHIKKAAKVKFVSICLSNGQVYRIVFETTMPTKLLSNASPHALLCIVSVSILLILFGQRIGSVFLYALSQHQVIMRRLRSRAFMIF